MTLAEYDQRRADGSLQAEPETPASMTRLRSLLAEEHPTNQRVVQLILGPAGVDLTTVANGREAVDACQAHRFDLILMDMQMPVMDGLAAARAIRAHEQSADLPRTPMLAMTANAMDSHVEACAAAGMDGHVTKPLQTERLYAAIAAAVAEAPSESDEGEREVA
jgi:CheY-like chemotaxis protein